MWGFFNTSSAKINFRTAVVKKRRQHLIHKLLLLKWPEKISVVEQRQKPRVWVPDRYRLAAKIQTLGKDGAVLSEAPARVWDIGLEGASLICPNQFSLSLNNETMIRITIWPPDTGKAVYLASQRHRQQAIRNCGWACSLRPTGDPSTARTSGRRRR
jgi:hypothetical protein